MLLSYHANSHSFISLNKYLLNTCYVLGFLDAEDISELGWPCSLHPQVSKPEGPEVNRMTLISLGRCATRCIPFLLYKPLTVLQHEHQVTVSSKARHKSLQENFPQSGNQVLRFLPSAFQHLTEVGNLWRAVVSHRLLVSTITQEVTEATLILSVGLPH